MNFRRADFVRKKILRFLGNCAILTKINVNSKKRFCGFIVSVRELPAQAEEQVPDVQRRLGITAERLEEELEELKTRREEPVVGVQVLLPPRLQ